MQVLEVLKLAALWQGSFNSCLLKAGHVDTGTCGYCPMCTVDGFLVDRFSIFYTHH